MEPFAVTLSKSGVVPEVGVTNSQPPPLTVVTVYARWLVPVDTDAVCAGGERPLGIWENKRLEAPKIRGGPTVKDTLIVTDGTSD